MAGFRIPGPMCTERDAPSWIDTETMCRQLKKATTPEIIAEFDAVQKQPYLNAKNRPLSASSFKTSLDLDNDYLTQRFDDLVTQFWGQLHVEYPAFDSYPMPVQYALLDMIFNLGQGTQRKTKEGKVKRSGIHQYVGMRLALDKKDWKKAGDAAIPGTRFANGW
ncbi:MAG: hypothetical protein ACLQNE_00830 [Thermoguttaceae bacterium]